MGGLRAQPTASRKHLTTDDGHRIETAEVQVRLSIDDTLEEVRVWKRLREEYGRVGGFKIPVTLGGVHYLMVPPHVCTWCDEDHSPSDCELHHLLMSDARSVQKPNKIGVGVAREAAGGAHEDQKAGLEPVPPKTLKNRKWAEDIEELAERPKKRKAMRPPQNVGGYRQLEMVAEKGANRAPK
jgi:hypothetical protein